MKADSTILGHRMGNRTAIKFRGDVDGGSFGGAVQACIGKLVHMNMPKLSIPNKF